jgi:hypothetical protein
VFEGLVNSYNANARLDPNTDREVREGDFIIPISYPEGETTDVEALEAVLRRTRRLQLVVRRPFEFSLEVTKRPIGMEVKPVDRRHWCMVSGIEEDGPIAEWNRARGLGQAQVAIGDHIIQVNGQRGTSRDLVRLLRDQKAARLVLQRPAAGGPSCGPVDVSRLTRVAKDDRGLLRQPDPPLYRTAIIQVYVRSQAFGGPDKSSNGHRYDSIPIANGMIRNGLSCQLLHYVHEEHQTFVEVCSQFAALMIRCAPGQVVEDGGAQTQFDDALRILRRRGVQIWTPPDVVYQMGSPDALAKLSRELSVGVQDTNAYSTVEAFREGFSKTVAFHPRIIRSRTHRGCPIGWIVKLRAGGYCREYGERLAADTDVLLLAEEGEGGESSMEGASPDRWEEHTVAEFIDFAAHGHCAERWLGGSGGGYLSRSQGTLLDQRFCPGSTGGRGWVRFEFAGDELAGIVTRKDWTPRAAPRRDPAPRMSPRSRLESARLPNFTPRTYEHDAADLFSGSWTYSRLEPDNPRYAKLCSSFLERDMPRLMPALDLADEPLPLHWTADFVDTALLCPHSPSRANALSATLLGKTAAASGDVGPDCHPAAAAVIAEEHWALSALSCDCADLPKLSGACCSEASPFACIDCVPPEDIGEARQVGNLMGQKAFQILSDRPRADLV